MSDTTENMDDKSETPQTEPQRADISQEKLDSLLHDQFGKGARKAESELLKELGIDSRDDLKSAFGKLKELEDAQKTESDKLRESIDAANADNERLTAENKKLSFDNKVSSVAIEAGVKERELFSHLYASASNQEGFEVNGFIATLKLDKPFLFGDSSPSRPRVDSTRSDPDAVPQNEKAAKARAKFA